MSACRARFVVALIVVLALSARTAGAAKPARCPDGRFLVTGPSILTGDEEHDIEAIVLADRQLSIGDACAPAPARVKRTKQGTAVRAKWKQCTGFTAKAKLAGTIAAPECTTLSGTFTVRKQKVRRPFVATRSECGDGLIDVDAGEGCEPPGTATCDAQCQLTGPATPSITIDTPVDFALTNAATIDVSGTIAGPVTQVLCNDRPATRTSTSFAADNVPLAEGHNTIVCVATAAGGAATASVSVSRDATGPRVGITTPKPSATLTASPVTATGFVNDLVAGDRTSAEPGVACNGVTATVANRTFVATGIPLTAGAQTITCVATDAAGNDTMAAVDVTLAAPAGPSIHAVSGDGQAGVIATALPAPLVAALDDGTGQPVAGKTVIFRVTENDGTLAGGDGTPRAVMVMTDANGRAAASFTLGTRAGSGNQQVRATAVGFAGEIIFTASATAGAPARIVVDSGTLQLGLVGKPLPRPFIATVVDAGNNRLAGVPVAFSVEAGGGSLDATTVPTDLDGRAHVFLTLGPTPDHDGQIVEATFEGNTGAPARFVASARQGGDPAMTRISGVVLDGSNVPVPNALVGIGDTSITTMTDDAGQFTIAPAPVGRVDLWIVGSTTTRAGEWPSLPYELVTVPGEDNTVGMPIYLPELDVAHGLQVDETHGGTIAPPDLPGFALTIAPGSATFLDGTRSGFITVTAVHPDKIPMVPQFGQQPRVIVTIQPAGTKFDPPAPLTIPNADGLPPGQKTEMFSFDHDIRSFVTIGTGTVSEDGSVIRSDPGVGVIKAGWHCGGNPAGTGTCNHECDDGEDCTDDSLVGGSCQHTPKDDGTPCTPAPDTLDCGGGMLAMANCGAGPGPDGGAPEPPGNGGGECQGGTCVEPEGKPKAGDVFRAMKQLCDDLSNPDGGCSGEVGQKMLGKIGSLGKAQIACADSCTPPNTCACTSPHSQVNIINPSGCRGAPLDKVLRHEMQHLLCDTSHNKSGGGPRPCAPDPTFACDQQCGLNPAAEGRCAGTVNPSNCMPSDECTE